MTKPKILVISFSDINKDARVLRELSALKRHGEIFTVGYGPTTRFSDHHYQISSKLKSLPQTLKGVFLLATRHHQKVELKAPAEQAIKSSGLEMYSFDLVVANDARALPIAFYLANGAPVWADMHEWAPEERTHVLSWRLLISPYMDYLCKKYLSASNAVTTVGSEIARLYQDKYAVQAALVRNAAQFEELSASVPDPEHKLRLVHSGAAVPGRSLEVMIRAVGSLEEQFSLDLYLMPANDGGKYLDQLRALGSQYSNITLHDPVKPHELPAELNQYDVGCFWIPPFNTNARLTLPNKIFDFIQARLAIAVGPSIEMSNLVNDYQLGVVSDGFSEEAIVASLSGLTTEKVKSFKENAQRAALELNFDKEREVIDSIVDNALN